MKPIVLDNKKEIAEERKISKASDLEKISDLSAQYVIDTMKSVLPKEMDAERFIRLCLITIRSSARLMSCSPQSIFLAMLKAAELKLQPSALSGMAYFVPYGNQCQLIIGYKGLMSLARRSNELINIDAKAVYQEDHFDYQFGSNPYLIHRYQGNHVGQEPTHFYAIAYFKNNNACQFEILSNEEIKYHRDQFSARGSDREDSPWRKHYDAMAKKTVLRKLCSLLPLEDVVQSTLTEEDILEAQACEQSTGISFTGTEASSRAEQLHKILTDHQPEPSHE